MKRFTLILLLFSCLNAWAYEYHASATDPSKGLEVEFNGEIATVTLYKSGAFYNNLYYPGNVISLEEWANVKYINFVSENGAAYDSKDWEYIPNLFNRYENGSLSLDFSSMVTDDNLFKLATRKVKYVKMPNGLVDLADEAFEDCAYLSAIGWSPALQTIGTEAFLGTAFTSFSVPEGVTSIGNGAFSFCPNLGSIFLPTTLEDLGIDVVDGSPVTGIHSHRKTAPDAHGDICDNTGWNTTEDDFVFYDDCILYIQPDQDTFNSYCSSPYWLKFFVAGAAKICLHTYDLNRPLVTGYQELEVVQPNVMPENIHEGLTIVEMEDMPANFYRRFPINTVYQRDMSEVKWYTIMLPFDVDAATVEDVFGEGTQILAYSGIHDYTLCFEHGKSSITANVPYLIKPGETLSQYEFNGSSIYYTPPTGSTDFSVDGLNPEYNQYNSQFVGTYCNKQIPEYAYYLKNGLFYYMPSENTQKGWKAYGGVVMINEGATAEGSAAARPSANYLGVNINAGSATGIDTPTSVATESISLEGTIYTLSGQQVSNPGKGIYIINGKKILIK